MPVGVAPAARPERAAPGGSGGAAGKSGTGGTGGAAGSGGGGHAGATGGAPDGGVTTAALVTSGPNAYWNTTATLTMVTSGTADLTVDTSTTYQRWDGMGGCSPTRWDGMPCR